MATAQGQSSTVTGDNSIRREDRGSPSRHWGTGRGCRGGTGIDLEACNAGSDLDSDARPGKDNHLTRKLDRGTSSSRLGGGGGLFGGLLGLGGRCLLLVGLCCWLLGPLCCWRVVEDSACLGESGFRLEKDINSSRDLLLGGLGSLEGLDLQRKREDNEG